MSINAKDLVNHKARLAEHQAQFAQEMKRASWAEHKVAKKFKDLTSKEKDDLLLAMALKLGMIME